MGPLKELQALLTTESSSSTHLREVCPHRKYQGSHHKKRDGLRNSNSFFLSIVAVGSNSCSLAAEIYFSEIRV